MYSDLRYGVRMSAIPTMIKFNKMTVKMIFWAGDLEEVDSKPEERRVLEE